jgi:hypothetical protein
MALAISPTESVLFKSLFASAIHVTDCLRERAEVELPALYPLQERIRSEARRFNVLDIGRRAGKTYLGTYLALDAVAEGHPVGWFAPNYKYLLEVWQVLTRALRPVATKANATERRIELSNGGVIEFWTLDGTDDPGRSRRYKLAIVDEAAIAPNLKNAWEQAIRPTLTDLEGSAWFLSTPKGLNYFYDLFQRGQDELAHPEWRSWQLPSSVNPYLPPKEIEAARRELPELAFKQEFLAEFLSGEGAVFRNVDACLRSTPGTPAEHARHMIVSGIDWGRSHDFTAISIFCCDCAREVFLDRFNQVGWDFQRERLLAQMTAWNVRHARVETNSIGSPNLEALWQVAPRRLSLAGFETTAKSKGPLIQRLALAFEKGAALWLPDPVGRHELLAYEATVTESGYVKYSAPDGGFDDTVIARALAWHAARPYLPKRLTEDQRIEEELAPGWRLANKPTVADGSWEWDGWRMAREYEIGRIRRREAEKNKDPNDAWSGWLPAGNPVDDPFAGWSPGDF